MRPTYPTYTVDGVAMDSVGWYLTPETRRRALPGVRAVSVKVPGQAGELPIVGLDLDTTTLPLGLRVTAHRPDGSEGDLRELEQNLEALYGVFGTRHRMLDVRHYPAEDMVRQADATVLTASEPVYNTALRFARVTVVLTVPGVVWRDVTTWTWPGELPGAGQGVSTLAGSTAPITDAVIRFTGPGVSPAIVDTATGGSLSRPGGLLAGQRLLVDCKVMRAAVVTSDTWDLAAGADVTGEIATAGPGSGSRWLHLTPQIMGGDPWSRAVVVTTSATSTSSASKVEIRGRRAFL